MKLAYQRSLFMHHIICYSSVCKVSYIISLRNKQCISYIYKFKYTCKKSYIYKLEIIESSTIGAWNCNFLLL